MFTKIRAAIRRLEYGHKVLPGEDFSGGITNGEAVALLKKDLRHAVNAVNQSLQEPVTQPQFDAMVDLAYNTGSSRFQGSDLIGAVNGHANRGVCEGDFCRYDTVHGVPNPGLLNRRRDEYHLFTSEDYGNL